MKKVPKFLSCLNVVKEIFSEMQSFFNISQKMSTLSQNDVFQLHRKCFIPIVTLNITKEMSFGG